MKLVKIHHHNSKKNISFYKEYKIVTDKIDLFIAKLKKHLKNWESVEGDIELYNPASDKKCYLFQHKENKSEVQIYVENILVLNENQINNFIKSFSFLN